MLLPHLVQDFKQQVIKPLNTAVGPKNWTRVTTLSNRKQLQSWGVLHSPHPGNRHYLLGFFLLIPVLLCVSDQLELFSRAETLWTDGQVSLLCQTAFVWTRQADVEKHRGQQSARSVYLLLVNRGTLPVSNKHSHLRVCIKDESNHWHASFLWAESESAGVTLGKKRKFQIHKELFFGSFWTSVKHTLRFFYNNLKKFKGSF